MKTLERERENRRITFCNLVDVLTEESQGLDLRLEF